MDEYMEGIKTKKHNYNIHRVYYDLKIDGVKWDYIIECTDKYGEQVDLDYTHYLKDARIVQKMMINIYK